VKWQVYGCVMTYNMLLRHGQTVSSRELFTGVKPSFNRDLRAEFGEYVQAHVIPSGLEKSGPKKRTVGAIALIPAGNDRGTWWFMGLRSGKTFMADRWDALPMPDIVIELMNQRHDRDIPRPRRRGATTEEQCNTDATATEDTIAEQNNDDENVDLIMVPNARENTEPDTAEPIIEVDNTLTTSELIQEHGEEGEESNDATITHDNDREDNVIIEHEHPLENADQETLDDNHAAIGDGTATLLPLHEPSNNKDEDHVYIQTDAYDTHMGDEGSETEPNQESVASVDTETEKDNDHDGTKPLGAKIIAGVRKSHRIANKRMTEARVLRAYRLSAVSCQSIKKE
jgi:hypothetical protein